MERIGRFPIVRDLTETNLSRLYLCRDPLLDRPVVLKVFAVDPQDPVPPFTRDQWKNRFLREGRIMARLDHANVLSVLETGHLPDGTPFHVLPFHSCNLPSLIGFDEESIAAIAALGDRARPRPLEPGIALPILVQVLRGLCYLHAQGIVHRDIKASNVLLTRRHQGVARICDFGMAKLGDKEDMRRGAWIGSDNYLSPEQRNSAGQVTAKADIYSAGVLAWRMLTGRLPGHAPRADELRHQGVSAVAARAVLRALAEEAGGRPSGAEFLAALSVRN